MVTEPYEGNQYEPPQIPLTNSGRGTSLFVLLGIYNAILVGAILFFCLNLDFDFLGEDVLSRPYFWLGTAAGFLTFNAIFIAFDFIIEKIILRCGYRQIFKLLEYCSACYLIWLVLPSYLATIAKLTQ